MRWCRCGRRTRTRRLGRRPAPVIGSPSESPRRPSFSNPLLGCGDLLWAGGLRFGKEQHDARRKVFFKGSTNLWLNSEYGLGGCGKWVNFSARSLRDIASDKIFYHREHGVGRYCLIVHRFPPTASACMPSLHDFSPQLERVIATPNAAILLQY